MKLVLDNLTYHDCPVELREKVTFAPEQRQGMLKALHHSGGVSEAVILQTCNRLEFYLYARKDCDCRALLGELLASQGAEAAGVWARRSRQTTGMDVARHLFEVAAGLDSQMVGENQILAQVKAAYTDSLESHMSRLIFHRLFHHAFRAGKAVRTQTDINCGAVSIGLAAVELARDKVNLRHARALVIGAGENAELVVRYLTKAGLANLVIANRDVEKARAMARRFGTAKGIGLPEIVGQLRDVDLIVSSTGATEPVLTYDNSAWHLSGRTKPLLIIDIAVPRDVDPTMTRFDFVTLYNIDDLNEQIGANRDRRNREVPKARAIVEEFVGVFSQWYESLDLVPVIARLTQAGLDLARSEARRYAGDFGDGNGEKLQAFAESLIKKMLHGPISIIKDGAGEPTVEQLQAVDLINRMFLSQDKGGQ
ncbi:MAG: glutamyl-tRNA reductase [Phycisphaerae bacterium]|nr:glutamyl-tRNA reductase [Phycisphaerae bacterium]